VSSDPEQQLVTTGGKREGAGRPPLPAKDRKASRLALRLTAAELRELERRAAAVRKTLTDWARQRLLG
jgi:hypothetical protein